MSHTTDTVWMTQAALDRLQTELTELTARDDEESQPRILQLRELIRRAEVGQMPDDGVVEQGMQVTIRFEADASEETFLLGEREVLGAGAGDLDVYSPASPLGIALQNHRVGDSLEYTAPNGSTIAITILAAVPFA